MPKISQLPPQTTPTISDKVPTVSGGTTVYSLISDLITLFFNNPSVLTSPTFQGLVDGWVGANQTWTYASATTITVPTDATTRYQAGDFIKLTQSATVKYFQISSVAATVLTVIGLGGVTVANSAITANYYAKIERPLGVTGAWQAWTPTFVNFTKGSATITAKYIQIGKTVHFRLLVTLAADSTMGTSPTFTLPVTAVAHSVGFPLGVGRILDSGSDSYNAFPGYASTTTGSIEFWNVNNNPGTITSLAPMTWTTNDAFWLNGSYEVA